MSATPTQREERRQEVSSSPLTGSQTIWWHTFLCLSREATNPPDLANFAESTGLIMVGIIHTHPDFGPQPSSLDLHQLHDLQRDNSSAVSIIISPLQNMDRIYSLTALGMDRLSNCHQSTTNTFHRQNNARDLYQAASNVVWYSGVTVLVDQC